jgi:hypothetical protein
LQRDFAANASGGASDPNQFPWQRASHMCFLTFSKSERRQAHVGS